MEFGIGSWFGYPLSMRERCRLIAETGFSSTMLYWDRRFEDENECRLEEEPDIARSFGLNVEIAHLSYDTANDIWMDTADGEEQCMRYKEDIEDCARFGISVAVLHSERSKTPPPMNELGLNRLRSLLETAEKNGVKIAIENLRRPDYTEMILSKVDSPALGLCYDSGHDFLFGEPVYTILERHIDRLFALHLHDNCGDRDAHLIPGEGYVDWSRVNDILKGFSGCRVLECGTGDEGMVHAEWTAVKYLKKAYEAAAGIFE